MSLKNIRFYDKILHRGDKMLRKILYADTKELDNYISIIDGYLYDKQRKIIKEAIEDHRASLGNKTESNYGKIISC